MEQLERIEYYEKILNEGEDIIENLIKAINQFEAFKNKKEELDDYYQSDERKNDVQDDENGKLPEDFPRGVLAEDYAYDFLTFYDNFEKLFSNLK